MSPRRRLRGTVTPPVGMLEDSDSDSDVNLNDDIHHDPTDTEQYIQAVSTSRVSLTNGDIYNPGAVETDELHFDESDSNEGKLDSTCNAQAKPKAHADGECLRIQRFLQSEEKRQHSPGMVLRSGSQLKEVKSFLDSRETSRRRSTSSINVSNNALQVRQPPVPSAVCRRRQSHGNLVHPSRHASVLSPTASKSVRRMEDDELNSNNNARRGRCPSKSPVRTKAGRRNKTKQSEGYDERSLENRRHSQAYEPDKHYHLKHMYDLDQTDDFSDSDSYSYTSSFTSTDGCTTTGGVKKSYGRFTGSVLWIMTVVTTMVEFVYRALKVTCSPVQTYVVSPVYKPIAILTQWLWNQLNQVVRWFIVLDTWMVSRNSRRNCCLCLPLLLLVPLLLVGGHYMYKDVSSGRSFFTIPALFSSQNAAPNLHQGDRLHEFNLHREVKQVLQQLQAEHHDWLTRGDVEALVRSMLNPEMESLKVSLLNMAKEGSSDQTVLKVNQNDARQRLLVLEEQMAALLAKAKILDGNLADTKTHFMGTLTGDRDKQSADMAHVRASLADLKAHIDSLKSAYNSRAEYSKTCCIDEPALMTTVEEQVNLKLAKMLDDEGKGQGTGGSDFTGWLHEKYVDHSELDQQLRLLTADIMDRISAGARSQSSDHSSSLFLSTGAGGASEDAIRLVVEDALLKYSADRTGLADYALESAGGSVLNGRCSETYVKKTAVMSVFGIPLFYMSSSPRSIIQPEVHPGQCWAFKRVSGQVVIQLAVSIRPTGFSLEHIPRSLSIHGNIDSAPRDFTVFGLKSEADTTGVNLGNFTYQTMGTPIQHFDVQLRNPGVFGFVELRVLNNHGNKDYTCVYRFRVHGVPQ